MNRAIRSWLLCIAFTLFTATVMAKNVVYAIAIGNNQPPASDPSLQPLRYADDDAVRYYLLFSRLARQAKILSVLDSNTQAREPGLAAETQPPTLAALARVLAQYRSEMRRDIEQGNQPVLFLSFSGHGSTTSTGEFALAFRDGDLTKRALYDDILSQLQDAQVHLIVDACHAAGVVGVRGPFDKELAAETVTLEPALRQQLLEQNSLDRFPNVGALVAASSSEEAHEWSRIEAGVFSYQVLSALSGAADVNSDYRIEYSEIQAFIAAANRNLAVSAAKPTILASPPASNRRAILLDLFELRNTRYLSAVPKQLGHFYVENERHGRILEAHLEGSQPILLALPQLDRLFLRAGDQEALIPRETLVDASHLTFHPIEAARRGVVDSALWRGLYASAYSPDYYRGYVDSENLASVEFGPPRSLPAVFSSETAPGNAAHSEPRDRPAEGRSPRAATVLAIASGAALVASASLGVAALLKKRSLDREDRQREAHELARAYETLGTASLVLSGVGVATAAGAVWLWPRATTGVTSGQVAAGGELVLQGTW